MPKTIQLRNVPDELHRCLKARAAVEGLSLSDYLIREVLGAPLVTRDAALAASTGHTPFGRAGLTPGVGGRARFLQASPRRWKTRPSRSFG
ncbi:MAG: FitA-like ribbon-helix-helix domain-containing protein [Candidatus Rokuibacteriota bacterium]